VPEQDRAIRLRALILLVRRSGLTALNIRIAPDSGTPQAFAGFHFEFYWVFFATQATNSSNLESKSLKIGDWFDFL